MIRRFLIFTAAGALAGCAGSPTHKTWSCAPLKAAFRGCASIAEIDARAVPQTAKGLTFRELTGAAPAALAGGSAEPGVAPAREGDTVLRILVAPWVDAAGDYHAQSEIFAVVRRGGWTSPVPPPPPPAPLDADREEGGA